jgi:hypothetical protein
MAWPRIGLAGKPDVIIWLSLMTLLSTSIFRLRVAHFAARTVVHGSSLLSRARGPMRQAVVIRISASSEIHPSCTDLFRQSKCLGRARTALFANFSIVERERDFAGMEWTGASVRAQSPGMGTPGHTAECCERRSKVQALPAA